MLVWLFKVFKRQLFQWLLKKNDVLAVSGSDLGLELTTSSLRENSSGSLACFSSTCSFPCINSQALIHSGSVFGQCKIIAHRKQPTFYSLCLWNGQGRSVSLSYFIDGHPKDWPTLAKIIEYFIEWMLIKIFVDACSIMFKHCTVLAIWDMHTDKIRADVLFSQKFIILLHTSKQIDFWKLVESFSQICYDFIKSHFNLKKKSHWEALFEIFFDSL